MTDKVVVLVTVPNRRDGQRIARRLVESKLAACVNITSSIQSVYWWQGKVSNDREFLLLIKSSRSLFPKIRDTVRELHRYTTPEIICLPIIDGSEEYLNWIEASLGPSGGGEEE